MWYCPCFTAAAVVQSLSCLQLFATSWTAAHQASLSFTISRSLLKLMSIESVMPSSHLILCCPLLLLPSIFPSIRVFSNELAFTSGGQSIGVSASASVLPMNIQGSFASELSTHLLGVRAPTFPTVLALVLHTSSALNMFCLPYRNLVIPH